MIRVLVVDDHPIVRDGLVGVLQDQPDLEVVGAAGSAEEALAMVERSSPDVVLLDLEMPGTDGVSILPHLLAAPATPRVLVFTAYDADDQVFGAIRAGAAGYLLKGAEVAEIVRAIHSVHDGGSYLAPRVASRVLGAVGPARRSPTQLSVRESEVLRLLAEGLATKQIARSLGITERTVKFHVTSIFTKLGANNRAQAIALAAQHGLL
ncbi:MAG TPA: response regulator transcription factor [Chloroflexota bacterium]|nr:response regulator transcription factor [Chloroflexota bacterium]